MLSWAPGRATLNVEFILTRVSVLTSTSEGTRRGIVLPFYRQGARPIPHCACSEWSDADPLGVTAWLFLSKDSPDLGMKLSVFRYEQSSSGFLQPGNEACRFQVRAERFSAAKDHILRLTYCRGIDGLPEVERSHAHFRHRINLPQSDSCMAFRGSGLARSAVTPGPRLVTDQRARQNLNIDSLYSGCRLTCHGHYRCRPRRLLRRAPPTHYPASNRVNRFEMQRHRPCRGVMDRHG